MSQTKGFKRKLAERCFVIRTRNYVVDVVRRYKHLYEKFVNASKKYHAHDAKEDAKVGDQVTIIESRPHSKLKNWELLLLKVSTKLKLEL